MWDAGSCSMHRCSRCGARWAGLGWAGLVGAGLEPALGFSAFSVGHFCPGALEQSSERVPGRVSREGSSNPSLAGGFTALLEGLKQRRGCRGPEGSPCPSPGLQRGSGCFHHPQIPLRTAGHGTAHAVRPRAALSCHRDAFSFRSTLKEAFPWFQLRSRDGPWHRVRTVTWWCQTTACA